MIAELAGKRTVMGLNTTLLNALKIAADRLAEDGCDCGTDEPGTCALCVVEATLELEKTMRLCEVLRCYRWATRQTVRELAKEWNLSAATISRIEHGEVPSGDVLAKILCWLLTEPQVIEGML